jgi:hypothetical protein
MKLTGLKAIKAMIVVAAIAAFLPAVVSADTLGFSDTRDLIGGPSRTVVFCDAGVVDCSATTSPADFEGAVVFNRSTFGFGRADRTAPPVMVGSALDDLVAAGLPSNTIFIDASSNGTARFHGMTFNLAADPAATPEPSTLALLSIGILGLAWSHFRRKPVVERV